MATMDTPNTQTTKWAHAAVARLMKRCTERAARELETKASELLLVAVRLRQSRP